MKPPTLPSHQGQGTLRSESLLHLAPGMAPSSFCMKPRLPTANKALCDLLLPPSLPLCLSMGLFLLSSKAGCHSCQLWTMLTCQEYSLPRNSMTSHPLPGSLCWYSQQVTSDQNTACASLSPTLTYEVSSSPRTALSFLVSIQLSPILCRIIPYCLPSPRF